MTDAMTIEAAAQDPLLVRIGGNGSVGGSVARSVAHRAPGILHLAVSVQVFDPVGGGWLLQRRAASKALFPNRWANTCCTHPAPGEDPAEAAIRRVMEETGLTLAEVIPAGDFTYRATDGDSGLVEHEHDLVFLGFADVSGLAVDPNEISEVAVLPYAEALQLVQSDVGTPWAGEVLRHAFLAINGHLPQVTYLRRA